jgi:hypothetical protein
VLDEVDGLVVVLGAVDVLLSAAVVLDVEGDAADELVP